MNCNRYIIQTIIKRIIYVVIGALIAFLTHEAKADYPKVNPVYKSTFYNGSQHENTDYTVICTEYETLIKSIVPSYHMYDCTETLVTLQKDTYQDFTSANIEKYGSCNGAQSLWGLGTCPGDPPVTCEDKDLGVFDFPVRSDLTDNNFTTADISGLRNRCYNGCKVAATANTKVFLVQTTPPKIRASAHQYAQSCSPDTAPLANTPTTEADCVKKGQGFATINGITTCAKAGTPGTPPAISTSTSTNTTNNNNQTTTTTTNTTTINSGGNIKQSTETQTTNPDGSTSTGSQQSADTQDSFCEKNPSNKLCKDDNKSSFGGSCTSAFTCDGDAIQCAIAKQQYQSRCDDTKPDTTSELGKRLIEGTEPLNGTDTFTTPHEISIGSLNETTFLSHSCLPDYPVGMFGNLPFSKLCDGLEAAGLIVLAFAYLIALGIIFK